MTRSLASIPSPRQTVSQEGGPVLETLRSPKSPNPAMDATHRRILCLLGLFAPLVFAAPRSIGAQQLPAATLIDPAICKACSVEVRRTATLGGPDSPLAGLPRVLVEDAGRNLVVQGRLIDRNPPLVFDSSGRYLGPLGRPGQGPGDVTPVRWLSTDSLGQVEVHSRNRINVFSARQELLSTSTLSDFDKLPGDMVRLGRGVSVELTNLLGQGPDFNPLIIRGPQGQVLREVHLSTKTKQSRPTRTITRSRREGHKLVWMAETKSIKGLGYEVLLIDTAGRARLRLERRLDWWTSRSTQPAFTPIQDTLSTPYPWISHIREDADGRVLVLLAKPRSDWKAVKMADRWVEGNYLTVLEVVDPSGPRVLGTAVVKGFPLRLVSDTRFATYREDSDGVPWIDIWQLVVAALPAKR